MTNPLPTPVCIACDARDSEVFWNDQNRAIRQCRSCGLLFVFPQPDRASLHDQFQSAYFKHGQADGQSRLELEFEAWRRPMLQRIKKQICARKSAGNLLDVGFASGALFEHFRSGDWELYGVEPSAIAFERAVQRFGDDPRMHLQKGYFCDMNLEPKSMDVVTILESLFYMPDPRRELAYAARILRDTGLLAIATPGYTYQRLRHSGPVSQLLSGTRCSLTPSHLFYFSKQSLAELLKGAGFRIVETVPLGSSVYGSRTARSARAAYMTLSRSLNTVTFGALNVAPHVLYLCQKSEGVGA